MRIGFEQANAIHNKWESGWGFNVQQSIMGNLRAMIFSKDKWICFFFFLSKPYCGVLQKFYHQVNIIKILFYQVNNAKNMFAYWGLVYCPKVTYCTTFRNRKINVSWYSFSIMIHNHNSNKSWTTSIVFIANTKVLFFSPFFSCCTAWNW